MCNQMTDFAWVTSICKMTDFYLQAIYIVNAPHTVGKLYSCSSPCLTHISYRGCRCFHVLELMIVNKWCSWSSWPGGQPFVCVVCELCCSFCQSSTSPGPLLTVHRRWRTSRQPWWWTSLQSQASHSSHTVVIHANFGTCRSQCRTPYYI